MSRVARPALFVVIAVLLAACAKREAAPAEAVAEPASPVVAAPAADAPKAARPGGGAGEQAPQITRKIIKNADLSLEADDPEVAHRKASAVFEAMGGFVVTSDVRHHGQGEHAFISVTMTGRVPEGRFDATLTELRKVAVKVSAEKVTGQDVTEEYYDLEARIRTQKAVESQYLEIMKETKSVKDALEVQKMLGDVRGEIERLEGRKRLLESQTSLSTITVHIGKPSSIEKAKGLDFGGTVREAASDAVAVAGGIVVGGIRLVGVLTPIALLIGLPVFGLVKLIRRLRRGSSPRA